MNYDDFLSSLAAKSFRVHGRSFAYFEKGDWQIAFIRFGGKYQRQGQITFVLCARPLIFRGLEGEIPIDSRNPFEYPFKWTIESAENVLKYESRLLDFEMDELETNGNWAGLFELLTSDLPKKLEHFGVVELRRQIDRVEEPGYIETIWLGSAKDA